MRTLLKYGMMLLFLLIFTAACSNNENAEQAADSGEDAELMISAAASLSDALVTIKDTYEKNNPDVKLKFNFGGSGSLQQQISQGAPVDLFFSAAEDKFERLVEDGMIAEEDRTDLLENELVLVVPQKESAIKGFEDLTGEAASQISIGTPETVPAGKYAKEALEKMNLWEEIESKTVYAKDVRQVLSYVATGNVDAGIVYKTDALLSDEIEMIASADPETHTPIIYPVGMIKDSKNDEAAKAFYDYLQTDEALEVFEDYGFITR